MRTEQEIRETIEKIKEMRTNSKDVLRAHHDGQIDALQWVLEKTSVEELNQEYLNKYKEVTQ